MKDNTTVFSGHSGVRQAGTPPGSEEYIGFLLPIAGEERRGELATVSLVALCVC